MIGTRSPRTRGTGARLAAYLRLQRQPEKKLEPLRRQARDERSAARLKAFLRLERGHRA